MARLRPLDGGRASAESVASGSIVVGCERRTRSTLRQRLDIDNRVVRTVAALVLSESGVHAKHRLEMLEHTPLYNYCTVVIQ